MRSVRFLTAIASSVVSVFIAAACASTEAPTRDEITKKYAGKSPTEWSETLPGIVRTLDTQDDVAALTLDLCGSKGDSLDRDLVRFLIDEDIPVTFFVSSRWIKRHPDLHAMLKSVPIFEIEAHGAAHVPASLNGRAVYGIDGTKDAGELYDEVMKNADDIERVFGTRPMYFRSGTAYYDEYAVELIRELGFAPVGSSILGDAGATYSEKQVVAAVTNARSGDIIIAHANHPERDTGRGLKKALPILRDRGFRFVKLSEYLK